MQSVVDAQALRWAEALRASPPIDLQEPRKQPRDHVQTSPSCLARDLVVLGTTLPLFHFGNHWADTRTIWEL